MQPYTVAKSEYVFERGWFRVRLDKLLDEEGKTREYPICEIGPVAAVLGVDDSNHFILQREYRPTFREYMIETSCGGLNPEEDAQAAAAREFEEETGHRVEALEKVGVWHVLTGKCKVDLHMFLGRVRQIKPAPQKLDPFEVIEPIRVSTREAIKMILDGRITNAEHIALILLAKEKHPEWFA